MTEKVNWKDVFLFGGAVMGSVAGAGFASGQEVMQFFTHLGFAGSVGAGLVSMALLSWLTMTILEDGRTCQFHNVNAIFTYYCGSKMGLFFEWFVPTLMLMAVSIMISAAGAAVNEHYGWHPAVGRTLMALLALTTVLLGLKQMVRIVGSIAPFFIAFTILMGLASILENPEGIAASSLALETLPVPRAYSNWFVSGMMYASFLLVGLMPFTAGVGRQARQKADTCWGGLFAGFFFLAGAIILSTGLLVQIPLVYDRQIPSLAMTANSFPPGASLFALLMLVGIYTASVSMLWTAVNRVQPDEKKLSYRAAATVMALLAYFGGHLQFSTMVGIVYPAVGYLGLVLIGGMILTKSKQGHLLPGRKKDTPS